MSESPGATRTACVVQGATPDQLAALGTGCSIRPNALGALALGPFNAIDCAASLPGPVYDVMYSARTGWFAVTVYRGLTTPTRWDNRPDGDAGYPRVASILDATTPLTILAALDIPASALGYVEA